MKDSVACIAAAVGLIAVFAFPVILLGGPLEFISQLVNWLTEPEFGGRVGGALFVAYIFSLPLLGIALLAYTATKLISARKR